MQFARGKGTGFPSGARLVLPVTPPSATMTLPGLPARLTLREAEDYALAHQPVLGASELRAAAETERV